MRLTYERLPALTEGQLDELVQAVEKRRSKTKSLRVLEGALGASKYGFCASEQVVKNGHSRGGFSTKREDGA